MIALERIAAILLCAGRSRRFGRGDKLLQPLAGRPLVDHAAATIASLPFGQRIAIVPQGVPQGFRQGVPQALPQAGPELRRLLEDRGFTTIVNPSPDDEQDHSLRLGIAAAFERNPAERNPAAILVCLGDMPYVSATHLRALARRAGEHVPAASLGQGWRSPPVLFPIAFAAALLDRPAREVLGSAAKVALVPTAPGMLDDFDTPGDFDRAAALP